MANKKQERSGRKDRMGKNGHRKAGLPSKAGKRKVYGHIVLDSSGNVLSGRRKTKSFEPQGGIVHNAVNHGGSDRTIYCDKWSKGQPVMRSMTPREVQARFN